MQPSIDLEKVKTAMQTLRSRGERISRRNVRQLLGSGGMSTIHKLMKDIEELDSMQVKISRRGISENFMKAVIQEIDEKINQATADLQEEVRQLQDRETEAIEMLSNIEKENEDLTSELADVAQQFGALQKQSDKEKAVAGETITRLEQTIDQLDEECHQLQQEIEAEKIESVKTQFNLTLTEQSAANAEDQVGDLRREIQKLQKTNAEIEKRSATSAQRATDLREALMKAEKRIDYLERR